MPALSVVIPCKNEEKDIGKTIADVKRELSGQGIDFELIVVSDGSMDSTEKVVEECAKNDPRVRLEILQGHTGFGYAVRKGLEVSTGDCVVIVMGDGSDDPCDIVRYYSEIKKGFDCCFGQRWHKDSVVEGYPLFKLIINRIANRLISILFSLEYTDITNAFKCYSREVIKAVQPVFSRHFDITVELPLKAIVRGYKYSVIPVNWYNRKQGTSNFKIEEMGSHYFLALCRLLKEKSATPQDKRKNVK